MRRVLITACIILSTWMATAIPAVASPFGGKADLGRPVPNNILPGASARPKVGQQQAASRVKQRYPGNKILSVNLIKGGGPPVYRIKMLSDSGVVKYVFVDGVHGEVFE